MVVFNYYSMAFDDKFTLEDKITQESLKAISRHSDFESLKTAVVGGFLVQLYSEKIRLFRPTDDIDIMPTGILKGQFFSDNIYSPISEEFKEYETKKERNSKGFGIVLHENSVPFFIHYTKFTKNFLERNREWKEREFNNLVIIEPQMIGGYPLIVQRIEDVLANKGRRINYIRKKYSLTPRQRDRWDAFVEGQIEYLGDLDLINELERVKRKRKILRDYFDIHNPQNPKEAIYQYKAMKDFYDIALLSRVILEGHPFDLNYFRESLSYTSIYSHEKTK